MLKKYAVTGGFDEMIDSQATVRPHYRKFQELFRGMTPAEFETKRQELNAALERARLRAMDYFRKPRP